jgi:hypothetical protein
LKISFTVLDLRQIFLERYHLQQLIEVSTLPSPLQPERATSGRIQNEEQRVENQADLIIPRLVGNRDAYVEFTSRDDNECRKLYSKVNTLAQDK